jgi:hypothetical protein
MKKRMPIAWLLRHLGRSPEESMRQVPCRDEQGRKSCLRITLGDDGVVLDGPAGLVVLDCLDVGRLRVALREAAVDYSQARSSESTIQEVRRGCDRRAA